MALRLSLFLPGKSLNDVQALEDFIIALGDTTAKTFGNDVPEDDFKLENLLSFIIIEEDEIPDPKNFQERDMLLILPVGEV